MKLSKSLLVVKILSKPQSAIFLGLGGGGSREAIVILFLSVKKREQAVGKWTVRF